MFVVELFENGQSIGIEFASTLFEANSIKIAHTTADPEESHAVIEDIATFNEDWLGWCDKIDWKAEHEADFGDYEPYGEDVDLAHADMLYRDAEASWYHFMVS